MEGSCSTGQSPQRAVMPVEEEEKEEEEEEEEEDVCNEKRNPCTGFRIPFGVSS
jgi:hypothetical protein